MSMLVLIKYYVLLDCVQSRAEISPLFRKDFREKPQADERSRVKHKKATVGVHYLNLRGI